uniref:hypothetical protein n=1 Tax=Rickettsia endosymbiont of Urophora cardui TaxID=3066265 RepID=UPI00313D35C1
MGECLNKALQNIITKNANNYSNIACIYYDPFDECANQEKNINGIKYRVRPAKDNLSKAQLSHPIDYQEQGDDFSNLKLYKIVAWDHASFPGNDYFIGSRNTDDGVAAAATNSMEVITNIKGEYKDGYYLPPSGNKNWQQVVKANNTHLIAKNNVKIVTSDGAYVKLKEFEKNMQQLTHISQKLTNLNIEKQDQDIIDKAKKHVNTVVSNTHHTTPPTIPNKRATSPKRYK